MVKIVFVAESWGAREEMFQHALVGSSGVELCRMLGDAGIVPPLDIEYPSELEMISYWKRLRQEHEIYTTNVFNCRPQDNKVDLFFTNSKEGLTTYPPVRPGKYLLPEMWQHIELLWSMLRELQPNLIIALGNTACWATLGESKISTLRGTIKMSPELKLKVLPTYHPAAVLRQWNLRTIVLSDLTKAKQEAESNTIKRIERWVTIEPTLAEIAEWFTRPAEYYAIDIETYAHSQISMIGFARSPTDALVIPFLDPNKPGWSYWPTVEEEMRAWRLADAGLRTQVPKLFQNGIYDLSYLLRAGLRPAACQDDTMLLHHSLYPEMLKGLGFLGSVYSNEIAWKPMGRKGDNLKRDA